MSEEDREGFLSRWSRRKRAIEDTPEPPIEEIPAPEAEAPPEAVPAAPPRASCPIPDIPEIDPATLPPLESLTAESDFGLFLRPGVPTLLRNAALRRMWSLDPGIRDYIGPVEYQWDFNTPGGLPFGFSNELVGDVSKLLAQAIGQVDRLVDKLAEDPAEPDPPPPESPLDLAPPEPEAAEPALVAEAPPPDPEDAVRHIRPRRHGRALPG